MEEEKQGVDDGNVIDAQHLPHDALVVPRPSRRRRPVSAYSACATGCRWCFILGAAIIALGITAMVCFLSWKVVHTLHKGDSLVPSPYQSVYSNTSTEVDVLPLIDGRTPFDVVLTVWARKAKSDSVHAATYAAAANETLWDSVDDSYAKEVAEMALGDKTEWDSKKHHMLAEVLHVPEEEEVFSGIVASNLSLSGKVHEVVQVPLDIPLKPLYDVADKVPSAHNMVRAVFTIIPPRDVLDRVVNVSSIQSDRIPRRRLLGSAIPSDLANNPEYLKLLDHLSTALYLGENGVDNGPPYLRTRAHFAIVNETHALQRGLFGISHELSARSECGKHALRGEGHRLLCQEPGLDDALFRTKYTLLSSRSENDTNDTAPIAYGPLISAFKFATGPKHWFQLPITLNGSRENDPESVRIPFSVVIASWQPGFAQMASHLPVSLPKNASSTDLAMGHAFFEVGNGLLGVPEVGTHPWTRFVISMCGLAVEQLRGLLKLLYWWTRVTSAGISHRGMYLLVAYHLIDVLIVFSSDKGIAIDFIASLLIDGLALAAMAHLVVPWTFESGWTIRRGTLSHRERACKRNDVPWKWIAAIAVPVYCVSYLPTRLLWLIPSHFPSSSHTTTYLRLRIFQHMTLFVHLVVQAWTNRRWQTFAGSYAIVAYLDLFLQLTKWVYQIEWIVGVVEMGEGIHLYDVLDTIVAVVLAWQAFTLPKVVWREDEDEE